MVLWPALYRALDRVGGVEDEDRSDVVVGLHLPLGGERPRAQVLLAEVRVVLDGRPLSPGPNVAE